MSKTCANCDHRSVCGITATANDKCCEWSGWHDAKEELPDDERIVLVIVETNDGNQHIGNGTINIKDRVARLSLFDKTFFVENDILRYWRELPEYEVKDGKAKET